MRYVKVRAEQSAKDKAYRIYATDALKMIAENTSRLAGGTSPRLRYYDLIKPPIKETRTSEEIIGNIRGKLKEMRG